MALTAGVVVADRFRLVRRLGEGGMGEVWLAHHVQLDTACAVKFIHADIAKEPGVQERFEREAKAAAQIRSPHVVHVLDYGTWDRMPYITMEYLEGEDLGARLKQRGRLSPAETVAIVTQVARALGKAHAAGLVHRDLKPENVFLVKDDDGEVAKVLDFGIAKSQTPLSDHNTRTGAMLGTPRFMSPEQAQGFKTVDHRSDLWSLGVITYRCIVGHLPFDSDALGDLLMRIMVHPMPVPSMILPGLPASFDAWWARAVARDPAQRFQSAKELADALANAVGVPVAAVGGGPAPAWSGAPTPPAVAAASNLPPTYAMPPHPQAVSAATPPPAYPSAPPAAVYPSGPPPAYPAATVTGPQPYAMAPPERTMSTASHTFGSEGPRKSAAPLVAALGVLAVLVIGVAAVVAFGRRSSSETDPVPVVGTGPTIVAPTTPAPVLAPPPNPAADTRGDPMAPSAVVPPIPGVPPVPVKAAPKPVPAVPPVPTRTGKVKIVPPPAAM